MFYNVKLNKLLIKRTINGIVRTRYLTSTSNPLPPGGFDRTTGRCQMVILHHTTRSCTNGMALILNRSRAFFPHFPANFANWAPYSASFSASNLQPAISKELVVELKKSAPVPNG